jgi:hypothetical protein
VTSEASITVTAAPSSGGGTVNAVTPVDTAPRAGTVLTHTYITYGVGAPADPRLISGTVDSFVVAMTTPGQDTTPRRVPSPLVFQGTMDSAGAHVTSPGVTVEACGLPAGALLITVRDLLVAMPPALTSGATWQDTVRSTVCRGDVPLTSTAIHSYIVIGGDTAAGASVVRVSRTSTISIAGAGSGRRGAVTITGTGTGRGDLWLDPVSGRLVRSTAEATTDLDVVATPKTAPTPTSAVGTPASGPPSALATEQHQHVQQRATQRVELK